MPLLVLFDVDGTLFLTHDALSGQAMRETLEATSASTFQRTQSTASPSRPDLAQDRASRPPRRGPRRSRPRRGSSGLVPGVRRALPRAARPRGHEHLGRLSRSGCRPLAPASGKAAARALDWESRSMARARMKLLALEAYFPEGQGVFGCDSNRGASCSTWRASVPAAGRPLRPSRWATPRPTSRPPARPDSVDRRPPRGFPRRLSGGGPSRRPRRGVLATPCLGWVVGGPGLDSVHGAGARASGQIRAPARAAPAGGLIDQVALKSAPRRWPSDRSSASRSLFALELACSMRAPTRRAKVAALASKGSRTVAAVCVIRESRPEPPSSAFAGAGLSLASVAMGSLG